MTIDKTLHILIIPSWYPLYSGDIGGSFFREQALALQDEGMKVGVIFPQIRSIKKIFKGSIGLEKRVDDGLPTYRDMFINITPRCKHLAQKRWVKRGINLFNRYVEENGMPDILHAHSLFNGGLLAYELSKKYNIPFVVTEHSSSFSRGLISKKQIFNAQVAVDNSTACIAVSNDFKHLLNKLFTTNKWRYIPNIVNQDFLNESLQPKTQKHSVFRFINICFLNSNKKVDVLINAFSIAHKAIANIELEIGGNGPELDNLKTLVNDLNLQQRVKFHGRLSREDVLKKVSEADSFVLSSEYETFGVVLVEALALGKPVIATKCGGPKSIVTPEVGYLVEKNSAEALAEAMISLYRNQNDFNQDDIRNYCYKEFSEKSVIRRLTSIYKQILKQI